MAERSNREIRKALKQYGKSKGYGNLWRQRTYDWLKQMREQDPTNESYVKSMNSLFDNSNEGSTQTTSSSTLGSPTWSASAAWDRMHQGDLSQNTTKTWSGTHTTSNPETDEPVQEQATPVDYSYGGTGNSFWNTSAQTFISNLNKTDAGRGALKGYDTNGDNVISEDELRAMQGGRNLTADAKVGSRTLGAFKDLMNEEDYNSSLATYNNWLSSRKPVNTGQTNTTTSTSTTPQGRTPSATNRVESNQVNPEYDVNAVQGMTAPSYTPDANGNVTPASGYGYTPQATSGPTWDPSAPANDQQDNPNQSMYVGMDGRTHFKTRSPYYQSNGVNGYTRRSGEEAQTERAKQDARNQAYQTVGRMAVNQVVGNTDRARSTMGKVLSGLEWVRDRWNSEEARRNRSRTIGEMTR